MHSDIEILQKFIKAHRDAEGDYATRVASEALNRLAGEVEKLETNRVLLGESIGIVSKAHQDSLEMQAERDEALEARDKAIAERDKAVEARDKAIEERDGIARQGNEYLDQMAARVVEAQKERDAQHQDVVRFRSKYWSLRNRLLNFFQMEHDGEITIALNSIDNAQVRAPNIRFWFANGAVIAENLFEKGPQPVARIGAVALPTPAKP